jgi:putative FmdB family regulatory protein
MPIYEFKCSNCNELFELLLINKDEEIELKCPHCKSEEFERVLSTASHSMGNRSGGSEGISAQTRTCAGGSCTTYDIPGPTR